MAGKKDIVNKALKFVGDYFAPNTDEYAKNLDIFFGGTDPSLRRRLYTGTSKDKDFSAFQESRHGTWLTANPEEASDYAMQNDSQSLRMIPGTWSYEPVNSASRVIPTYARVDNPYRGELPDFARVDNYKKAQSDWFDKLRAQGYDAWVPDSRKGEMVVVLKDQGNKVKSAIGNAGTFDLSKKHMNKAEGGSIREGYQTKGRVVGDIVDQALKLVMGAGEEAAPKAAIRAYHASPHDFDKFEWSPRTFGTGEGAQSYGAGLYFAESPLVSGRGGTYDQQFTRKLLELDKSGGDTRMNRLKIGDQPLTSYGVEYDPEFIEAVKSGNEFRYAQNRLDRWHELSGDEAYPYRDYALEKMQAWEKLLNDMHSGKSAYYPTKSRIYEVDINARPTQLLDWDTPIKEQSGEIQRAVGNLPVNRPLSNYSVIGEPVQIDPYPNAPPALKAKLVALDGGVPYTVSVRTPEGGIVKIKGATPEEALSNANEYAGKAVKDLMSRTGGDLVKSLERGDYSIPDRTAKLNATGSLYKEGIPGLRYLDAGSRSGNVADPTRNYVIWNDQLIDLKKKYEHGGRIAKGPGGWVDDVVKMAGKAVMGEGEKAVPKSLRLYHGTTVPPFEFPDPRLGEFGFHMGTPSQANSFAVPFEKKDVAEHGRVIPLDVDVKNPLRLKDYGRWDADVVYSQLADNGIVELDLDFLDKLSREPHDPANHKAVQKLINDAGYDSIVYLNRREGVSPDIPDYLLDDYGDEAEIPDDVFKRHMPGAADSYLVWDAKKLKSPFGEGSGVGFNVGGRIAKGPGGWLDDVVKMAGKVISGEGEEAAKTGIRAYHGSPHDFDKFDMSKIGTGEGAQAYGHGLYFADREGIAKSYRDALSPKNYLLNAPEPEIAQKYGQDVLDMFSSHGGDPNEIKNTINRLSEQNKRDLYDLGVSDVSQVKPQNDWGIEANLVNRADRLNRLQSLLASQDVKINPGHMYEVNIAADPNTFLDWDKPLSEQPEAVRRLAGWTPEEEAQYRSAQSSDTDALLAALEGDAQYSPAKMPRPSEAIVPFSASGDELHQRMFHQARKELGGKGGAGVYQARVAEKLREAGIPGIKYLDAGSRGAGDGTRNYVVFDDKLISIIRKYGIAGASAMLGYNLMEQLDPKQALAASMADQDYQSSRPQKPMGGNNSISGALNVARGLNGGK